MTVPDSTSMHPKAFRSTVAVSACLTLAIGIASFVLSFTVLRDLALMAGIPTSYAWLLPFIVDGTIMQATLSVVTLSYRSDESSRRGRRFFWSMLSVAAAVSISGNAFHAFATRTASLSPPIAAGIATIAPVFLLAMTHGIAVLVRSSSSAAALSPPIEPEEGSLLGDGPPGPSPGDAAPPEDDLSDDVRDTVRLRHEHPEWSWSRIGDHLGVAASTALRRYRRWEETRDSDEHPRDDADVTASAQS